MAADPNIADFNQRLKRIRRIHAKGGRCEAPGTLGSKSFNRHRKKNTPILGPVLLMIMAGVSLKAVYYAKVGPEAYGARVAKMDRGTSIDKMGAVLMRPDAVTLYLAAKVKPYFE